MRKAMRRRTGIRRKRAKQPLVGNYLSASALVAGLQVRAVWEKDSRRPILITIPLAQLDDIREAMRDYARLEERKTERAIDAGKLDPPVAPLTGFKSGFKSIGAKK